MGGSPRRGFLALGDSYTIGEGVPEAGRWPVQLVSLLRARGVAIDDPQVIATTGWTTDELDAGIDAAHALAPIPNDHALVSLLIGVNNQYRERSLDDYEAQFAGLLERAIGFAGGEAARVIVLAIPDWGVTPFAMQSGRDRAQISMQLDAFNAAAQRIAQARGARFVDTAAVSRERGGEVAMLADDGLHPSAALYAQWAEAALPAIERALGMRRMAASDRAGHHQVSLQVLTQREHLLAHFDEAALRVERDRARVPLPHAEPERRSAVPARRVDAGVHQQGPHALSVEARVNVEALDLAGRRRRNAPGPHADAQLGEPRDGLAVHRQPGLERWSGDLLALMVHAEPHRAVPIHVGGGVRFRERGAEGRFGDTGQREGVGGVGAAQGDHGCRVLAGWFQTSG